MEFDYFAEVIDTLNEMYGTKSDMEHKCVHEFWEGPIPVFKLILNEADDENPGMVIIAFHIELDAPSVVQWFLRVRMLVPELHLSASYLKDQDGVTYVADDAEMLRLYTIEQEVIAQWQQAHQEEPEEEEYGLKPRKVITQRAFIDQESAAIEFEKMDKKKGDFSH